MGACLSNSTRITEEMIQTASEALCECITQEDIEERGIYPRLKNIREVSLHIACKVIIKAME